MEKQDEDLIELLQDTTVHGLNHVYNAHKRRSKIFWFFLFSLGVAAFFFNVIALVEKYLSKSVLVNHFIGHENFLWPDLTICNPTAPFVLDNNSASFKHWKNIAKEKDHIMNILSQQSELFKRIKSYNNDAKEIVENAILMSTVDPTTMRVDDFRRRMLFYGYSTSHPEIYLIKEYEHHYTNYVVNDSKELFSTQIVQIRNNIPCHTFQIEKSKSINYTSLHSLKFFVNLNYDSYETFNSSYITRSLLLYITRKNYLPKKDEIIITPGYNNEVSITQVRSDYSESQIQCRKYDYEIELYDTRLLSTSTYKGDYEDCRKITSQNIYVEYCNCYSPFLPIYKNISGFPRLCFNATLFSDSDLIRNADCMFRVYDKYSTNSTFKEVEKRKCERYKSVKCDELIYSSAPRKEVWVELHSGKMNKRMKNFIQHAYKKIFNKPFTNPDNLKEINENIGMLSITRASQYGNLKKERLEYSYSNLLSDIGGLMGLCLGLSVVGLFEIGGMIYFLLLRLFMYCFCRKHQKEKEIFIEENLELDSS